MVGQTQQQEFKNRLHVIASPKLVIPLYYGIQAEGEINFAGYHGIVLSGGPATDSDFNGFAIGGGYRYYYLGQISGSPWAGLNITCSQLEGTISSGICTAKETDAVTSIMAESRYRWTFEKMSFSLFGAYGYGIPSVSVHQDNAGFCTISVTEDPGMVLGLGFGFGYSF
jgi:hypothetical protein